MDTARFENGTLSSFRIRAAWTGAMRSPRQYQGSESCAGTAPGRRVADRKSFLLCGSRSSSSPQCVDCLHAATGLETHWAQSLQEAATRLREQTYSAVVIDQFLLETDPAESDQMIEHLGTAFPIYLNFAVTGMERLVREVRSALHRRKREEGAARRAVADQMHSEMRETLTAMLLSCELAMSVPEVPDHAVEKIRAIDTLARRTAGSAGDELTVGIVSDSLKLRVFFGLIPSVCTIAQKYYEPPPSAWRQRSFSAMPNAPAGLLYPGDRGVPAGLIPTFKKGFAPRVGVAWNPTGSAKWLVTSAYGIFYEPYYTGQGGPLQSPISAPPFLQTPQVSTPNFADPFNGNPPINGEFSKPLTNLTLTPNLPLP